MPRFHRLRVKDIRRETPECVSISFDVPGDLREEYQFIQGQHLTLRTLLHGEEVRRSYSICVSPAEGDLRVAVKKVPGGQFSTFVNEQLASGDVLDVMTPLGSFHTDLQPTQRKHYVAFAAGSGITPVISLAKTTLETEPESHFTLFYGNRRTDSIIFKEELEALKNKHLQRFSLHHLLTQEDPGIPLFHGRLTAEKCREICQRLLDVEDVDEFFICGPEAMMEDIRATLLNLGVSFRNIHFELFTSPVGKLGVAKNQWASTVAKTILAHVQVTLDGKTFAFDMPSAGDTILDAATKAGGDLPFACKGGVCCTCKAKLLLGEVEMEVNYGLAAEEVEAGYILTCQSHPKTDKVILSFDE